MAPEIPGGTRALSWTTVAGKVLLFTVTMLIAIACALLLMPPLALALVELFGGVVR